jgi:hypothetical protein
MSYEKDPPPLTDASSEAPESLRALLRSAKTDLPTAAELARLEAKLGPLLSGAGAPATAPGMSALGKASLALVGGLLVTGGVYLATRGGPPAPAPPPATQAHEPVKAPAEPSPVTAPPAPATAPSVEDAPAKPSATATAGPTRTETGGARSSVVPEDQLLERARRALASDPNRALALTREHARTYPNGVLAQEREVIAIEALKRLGRSSEADSRRGTFEERYPQSAHRRNLEGTSKADAGK